ncbi:MAG: tyrosine-type recombinase/integrase [Pseudomonadota bacterium]|nr:tyrosine-type recombinase/integrase [Pseudomonadota bacterium]
MGVSIGEVVARADVAMDGLGHAPSTRMQYRWAWSRFDVFCRTRDVTAFSGEAADAFLDFVTGEFRAGRFKEWKYKLLRKAVLVLSEVAATGSYRWAVARAVGADERLDPGLRLAQQRFVAWLAGRGLAPATVDLYATVSRKVLSWLPGHGVLDVREMSAADVAAAVVFLSGSYRPASMRAALSALRVWCGYVEQDGGRPGLSRAVPSTRVSGVRPVAVITAAEVDKLVATADPSTAGGLRDRAILLLAARTGLRPSDITGMRLGDIDWRTARITVTQHKTGEPVVLPLLADVGGAISGYLLSGRPGDARSDRVFVRAKAPHVALAAKDLHYVASRAFTLSGVTPRGGAGRGMRVLRASLASRMLESDTALPVIAAALGHRGTGSVKHYLSADEKHMRACCLDFTGIAPRQAASS